MGDFKIIYDTKGKAKEYAPLGVELYTGCSHGCAYCFVPKVLNVSPKEFHSKARPIENVISKLEKDAKLLKKNKDDREILLCFHSDPYQPFYDEEINRKAIETLIENDLRFTILTKSGLLGTYHFDLLRGYEKFSFGTTLIFTNQDDADKWEPNAAEIDFRIEAIKKARNKKIKTWVSLEPVIDPKQALELIQKYHSLVDHWKIGKINYHPEIEAKVDWKGFTRDVKTLLNSLGADYYLKKSLTDLADPELQRADVRKAAKTNVHITEEKMTKSESPWTKGDIPTRKGNCNILVIAPHGHPEDDVNTGKIASQIADKLNCYAVINEKYQKPESAGQKKPDIDAYLLDLNDWDHIIKYPKIQKEFLVPINKFKKDILNQFKALYIIHVHGIGNKNIQSVAKIVNKYKKELDNLHVLVGYGQRLNDTKRQSASATEFVKPFIKSLEEYGLNTSIAPVDPIIVKKKKKWYCGNHNNKLNQKLYNPKFNIQSVQLEIKRDCRRRKEIGKTAEALAMALTEKITFWPALAKSSEIKEISIGEIDLSDGKFKSRIESYGVNQKKFDELTGSIKTSGILNNIIVRTVEGKEKYQLISGFRRLSALHKIYDERNEDISNAKISAKIFPKLPDEEAYNISFAENLAREDLSLWEIANSCKAISDDLHKAGETKFNIENHLMKLMQKGQRTVRRYLRIIAIKNEEIRKDIHNGNLDFTVAELFSKKDFNEEDRVAVHQFYRNQPMSSRQFEQFVGNLLVLRSWSDLKIEKILSFPGAAIFLKLDPKQLKNNVRYLNKQTGKPVDHILERNISFLKDSVSGIESKFAKKPFLEKFRKRSKALESKIGKVFDTQKVGANLSIKPGGTAKDEMIKVSISAPADSIQKAIKLMDKEIGKDFAKLKDLWKKPPKGKGTKKKSVNKKFKGWKKVNLKAEDGLEKEATAPIIISASRATDLPAFYSDWFMERLRQGYLVKKYPRNPKKTEHISFSNTRLIVFWTKNPDPIFQYLNEIEQMRIGYYFQYTLNDYEGDALEPNLPPLKERINCFKKLSKRIGKERVIWRFDPLILTDVITKEKLLEKVHGIMTQLSGFTEKLVISFMKADNHKKVVRNLNKAGIKYRDFSKDDIDYLASYLAKIGKEFGVEVAACAEEFDLTSYGIVPNKCIDDDLIRRVFSQDDALIDFIGDGKGIMDMGQRKTCRCIVSKDIGEYHTCRHLCIYCYANVSEKIVNRNVNMITQTGEMLLPKKRSKYQDWIYETKSCCNGCSNDCIYCFAKGDAVTKKRMKLHEWKEGKVRPHDVDKEYKFYDDPVMFPGTHDYTTDNFDACFTVLKKILAAKNRVLIVSKPRMELITRLCNDLKEYKKSMLFRFTIGSMNNEILSFWDQYAPLYEERKQSLEYAFNSGYQTSVSVEPMLDSEHIEELVNDLSPYVNHSIWIGTMNHAWYFDTDESKAKTRSGKLRAIQNTKYYGEAKAKKIREATEKILEGQSKENLKKIYGKLKDHPLVKWKWHIRKALGLPLPDKPEEWPAD